MGFTICVTRIAAGGLVVSSEELMSSREGAGFVELDTCFTLGLAGRDATLLALGELFSSAVDAVSGVVGGDMARSRAAIAVEASL